MIAIVGPTASGKTALALELAEEFNGEIICADSRTLYRGMDIGTAKPTAEERARVPHHILDVLEPGQRLGAAEFAKMARAAEADIVSRGKLAFLVGGSGLYIDSVVYDYAFPGPADPALRAELEALNDAALVTRLGQVRPEALSTVDLANRRRVIRAIETVGESRTRRAEIRPDVLMIGCSLSKLVAQYRIEKRVQMMLEAGFLDEVKRIGEGTGWNSEAMQIIGYRAMKDVVLGTKTLADGVSDFVRGDMALYKKQVTWFKRNNHIHWLERPFVDEARQLVDEFI